MFIGYSVFLIFLIYKSLQYIIRKIKQYLRLRYRLFIEMTPRVKKYGIKYYYSIDFRKKCRNRECTLRDRKKRGNAFRANHESLKIWLFRHKGKKCFWCNKNMDFEDATIDHIVPVSIEKNNKKSNLRLIHEKCRVERDKLINKGILKINGQNSDYSNNEK